MPNIIKLALIPAAISLIISYLVTPVVIKLAWKFGLIDDPRENKHPKVIHTKPIPRAGGLGIFIALFITSLLFLPLDKHLLGILLGGVIIIIVGLLDDKYNLSPYTRLIIGLLSASIPIAAGIGIAFLSNPFGGILNLSQPQISFNLLGGTHSIWILSDIFALIWIVSMMNMVNMGAKGLPGQLPGVVVIAATTIAVLSMKFSADITQWPVIILASISAGAYLGFLPWNFRPQKIMPGYSGSTLAGYILAVLAILSTAKVGVLVVVLGIPLVDTGYTIVRRIVSGKSPVWGDRGHLHHKLLDAGWSQTKVTLFYWLITGALGILAYHLNTPSKFYTMVGVTIFVGSLILWLTYRPKLKNPKL
jgi:UDP-GlcNAc:undecaprenyl-phosphate GlcNAc-1-phosphate transferase